MAINHTNNAIDHENVNGASSEIKNTNADVIKNDNANKTMIINNVIILFLLSDKVYID